MRTGGFIDSAGREGGGRGRTSYDFDFGGCAQVSRRTPLPGGYEVGDKVFFTGASQTFGSGNKVVHGQQGEVTGPANGENSKGKGVTALFPGNKGSVNCYLTSVRLWYPSEARLRRHVTFGSYEGKGYEPGSVSVKAEPQPSHLTLALSHHS